MACFIRPWICDSVNFHGSDQLHVGFWTAYWLCSGYVAWWIPTDKVNRVFGCIHDSANSQWHDLQLAWIVITTLMMPSTANYSRHIWDEIRKGFICGSKVLQQLWCSDCSCVNCWSMICYWCDLKFSMNIESYYFQLVCVSVTCCWYECEMVYLISDVTWFANDIIYFLYLKKMSACVQLGIA